MIRYFATAFLTLFLIPSFCFSQSAPYTELAFIPSDEGFITSWLQLGSISAPPGIKKQNERLAALDPLGIADLDRPPSAGEMRSGKRWKTRFSANKFLKFGKPRQGTVYLASVFRTPKEQKVWLGTGSDGGIEIWCNGKRLLRRNYKRRAVPDTDLTLLDLNSGDNLVVIKLFKADKKQWRIYTRLMGEDFGPPKEIAVVLPGSSPVLTDALIRSANIALKRKLNIENREVFVEVGLEFRGGRPIGEEVVSNITLTGSKTLEKKVDFSSKAPAYLRLRTFHFKGEPPPEQVHVGIGAWKRWNHLGFRMEDIANLHRATKYLEEALKRNDLPRTSLESAAWRVEHLKGLIESGDRDYKYLTRELRDTVAITKALAEGRDPYFGRKGEIQRRGYKSKIDGSYNPYALYVPHGWREEGDKRFGLVVSLHGLGGAPIRNIQTVFGRPREEGEEPIERERHPKRLGRSPFFVLSPDGFGNSGYRAFGEVDVLEVLERVRERYRIDPDRIYVTGFSMGGIGSAAISLRNPGIFAAAVPLCGYHSLFIYPSVRNKKLRPWEELLVSFNSNKDWAINGEYLPLHIVHGLQDNPLNSRLLVDRYNHYGYKVTYLTPDEGHDVWTETYKDRWIFSHFRKYKRKTKPRHVAFRTSRLRYRDSYWVRIDDALNFGKWIDIDATWEKSGDVKIKTDNVGAFTINNVSTLGGENPVVFNVEGQSFDVSTDRENWSFYLKENKWIEGIRPECESLCKRPGLTGPIGDAFYEPLLFVYGSGDPNESTLAKRRIKELGKRWAGVNVKWPVKADVDVTDEDIENHSLVLVGTPKGNSLLKKIADKLPIRVQGDSVVMGNDKYTGKTVSASFVYPNPLNPNRYVVVHTGTTKEALFYVAHPPRLLPDYLIYDASKWGTKRGRVLGEDREILAGGFFDKNWQFFSEIEI